MIVAYFDESGHIADQAAFCLAVVISKANQWERFEQRWRKRLHRDGIRVFHMSEFQGRKGEFKNMTEHDRTALLTDLSAILVNTVRLGSIHCIATTDWNDILASQFERRYERPRPPYVFLLQGCLHWLETRVELRAGEKIACVCEENKPVAYAAAQHYTRLKKKLGLEQMFGTTSFVPKGEDRAPLEAAGTLAYLGFKYAESFSKRKPEPTRQLLKHLLDSGQTFVVRYDRGALMKFQDAMQAIRNSRRA